MRASHLVWLLLVALSTALVPTPAAAAESPRVVVVGVPGLGWDDVVAGRTPLLADLARDSAVGVLSVKAAGPVTCLADGWLTLGAGNRVSVDSGTTRPCTADLPSAARLETVRQDAARGREDARVGALGAALAAAGECATTVGDAPALAAPAGADGDCAVRLVDAGSVEQADAVVAREAAALGPDGTLLVVGVAQAVGQDEPSLQLALASGAGYAPGALVSTSTRRAPYVQLVDVAPTVLALLGLPALEQMTGHAWRSQGDAPSAAALQDLTRKAGAAEDVTVPFFVVLIAALVALLAVAAVRRSWRLAEVTGLGATAALGASYVANLVPWWRGEPPLLWLLAVVLALSAAVVAGALRISDAVRPAGLVCALVAGVLLLDLLTGARLQMSSVAGYSSLIAGRFSGIGNVAFGVLLAAVLLAAAAATHDRSRRTTLVVLGVVGALAVVVDGAPPFGSDVGGVLALVPAFAVLALLRTDARVSLLRLLSAGLAGAAVVTAFAVLDHQRPAGERTHLGRFVQQVLDGTAGTVLARKAEAVLDLLFRSPVTALLPLVVAAVVWLVARPPRPLAAGFAAVPAWRHGLLAVGVGAAVGFAANDSGPAVAAMAVLLCVPATVAVTARVSRGIGTPTG